MQRRTFLQSIGCVVPVLGADSIPSVGGQPYRPLGHVEVPQATEAAVGPTAETVYVATQDGFSIVDVATPDAPTVVDTRTGLLADRDGGPLQEILDVKVDGDRLLVAGPANHHDEPVLEGVALYSVAEPRDPQLLTVYETSYPIHNAALSDGYAYLVNGSQVVIVDLEDTPTEVGRWRPRDHDAAWADVHGLLRFAHDVSVHDDRVFVAEWDAGTFILDISDRQTPEVISRIGGRSPETLAAIPDEQVVYHSLSMPGNHHTAAVNDDAAVLVLNKEAWKTELTTALDVSPLGVVELWDITDDTSPQQLASIDAPPSRDPHKDAYNTTPHNFDIVGDRLYTAWYDGGVKLHDISTPTEPELLAWWRAPTEWTFWTAQYATEEFFIASSHSIGRYNFGKGAVFTFPNRPGDQPSPPPLTETTTTTRDTTQSRTTTTTPTSTTTELSTTGETGSVISDPWVAALIGGSVTYHLYRSRNWQ